MVSGRPLLYLSLPGVAFILGVFWFRRRNKNRGENDTKKLGNGTITADKDLPSQTEVTEDLITKTNTTCNNNSSKPTSTPTKSMNINGTIPSDEENPANRMFGKSAPIKIVQNGRGPSPVKQTAQQQLDSEVLKTKIQDAEHKLLRSIEEDFENLSSPVDLPDSINNRTSFYSRNVDIKKDKPVVIMATTTPKISPENSFLESKYTKDCEEDSNKLDKKENHNEKDNNASSSSVGGINGNGEKSISPSEKVVAQTNIDAKNATDDCTDNCGTTNVSDKRNVDAASPSLSLCSVQSGDSGKGSSLPRSEATRAKTTYEFFLPDSLVGYLYGRRRSFINQIKSKTNATVVLRKKMYPGKLRVCAVEGTDSEIQAALALIRQRLPAKRYPKLTMQRIHFALPQSVVPLSNESLLNLQLNLIEGINNDVVVSAIISGTHIFVQQPLHPTHPSLAVLQKCLYESYTTTDAPLLPGVELNAVCVMPVNAIWYRVQIVDGDVEDPERCVVKFLDFGGYMNVHLSELRQIRSDFMTVPFQATECILSNIEPIDSCWTPEFADILCRLTKGIVLQAQIAGYNSHNIPEIFLFACLGPNNVIFINKELVARNLAKWVDIRD
ncbi:A-kinase anchor protein 1, mitochondrial-like [Musca domestica]|uniref:A-kinase anchor protein 1, mitochondrial-like n=1 Tax=Musca domestica TaxID=7370 RepID=A0ABM3VLF0_MUSDO|nr:A-kinase anchor protein 1, mitochondrial-like [Musca domestica]XP_058986609.1 A-kinase anchor protein 1, mitochondrial-like [Musca domestica]